MLGFLGSYGTEEGLVSGTGIWTLAGLGMLTDLPDWAPQAYLAAIAILLIALGAWIAFRPRPASGSSDDIMRFCADAALLGVVLMTALSPHYAWYFAWLAIPATIAPTRAAIWLSAAAMALYSTPLPDGFVWQSILYVPAIALMWVDARSPRNAFLVSALQGSF